MLLKKKINEGILLEVEYIWMFFYCIGMNFSRIWFVVYVCDVCNGCNVCDGCMYLRYF